MQLLGHARGSHDRYRGSGLVLLMAALIGGCALSPPRQATDGPEANPPAGLAGVPDAEPKLEAIRSGGPNKPYVVLGRRYVPMTQDQPLVERGLASWYGRKFQGRPTSSGEPYDMYAMTAAHPTLPIPSYVWVRNPANGREVVLRVNDRGPFHPGRIIDLSYTAALKLDLLRGVAPVEIERITYQAIRTGAWRREADATRFATTERPQGPMLATAKAAADATPATIAVPGDITEPTAATEAASTISTTVAMAATAVPVTSTAAAPAVLLDTAVASPVAPPAVGVGAAAATSTDERAGAAAPGFWVQLGAFRERDGADSFQRRVGGELSWLRPLLAVFDDAALFRLQAGPYPSRERAHDAAESIRAALQLVPLVVERR